MFVHFSKPVISVKKAVELIVSSRGACNKIFITADILFGKLALFLGSFTCFSEF